VPAYVDSLERTLGPGSAERLFADFDAASATMQDHARAMFERWVDVATAAR
jgi:hypothetical protein